MNQPRICPNCRSAVPADAPQGVCPACALRAGFVTGEGPDSPTRMTVRRSEPLPADELARRLPELERFELIGQGGMGAVYRARHRKLDRAVAVKVLNSELWDNAAFAERFTREARTMAQLDHPNIVAVYDFGHRDDLYYLVMELVDGVNLRDTIEDGGLEAAQALAVVPQVCEALQYAHDQGVVHRDIKPENILVDRKGSIKIADFGLAKLVGGETGPRLTQTAQIMGTPSYMAPEQIEHPGEVDHRADIFALGVVFYEILTGELPLGRFAPPSRKVRVDVRLDDVVLRALEKEPRLRYQQASEFQTDVEVVSGGAPEAVSTPAAAQVSASSASPDQTDDYEYRSPVTVFGLPLIHIAHSRDPDGARMRVANGLIAIGDVAIGAVAIGAFSFGGIAVGGISVGLVSLGGVVAGLLTALGGVAFGGFAVGGFAAGWVGARGALPLSYLSLSETALAQATVTGWLVMTGCVTVASVAAGYAWLAASRGRTEGPG